MRSGVGLDGGRSSTGCVLPDKRPLEATLFCHLRRRSSKLHLTPTLAHFLQLGLVKSQITRRWRHGQQLPSTVRIRFELELELEFGAELELILLCILHESCGCREAGR